MRPLRHPADPTMRPFGPLLLLLAALPLTAAQDPPADQGGGVEVAASSDLDVVFNLYKIAHGGKERFDGLRTMAFKYTAAVFDEEGNELKGAEQEVVILYRPDLDEQEQRTVRISTEVSLGEGDETARTISLVTSDSVRVWVEGEDGEFLRSDAKRLEATAAFHATALLNQLDLLYRPDSKEIRSRFGGVLKRDGKDYATVETEYSPGRNVPEPARLYFSGISSLIERIDAFDPKLHMRTGTVHIEGYEDHGGIKFPGKFRQVDRRGRPIGNWYFEDVRLNEEFEEDFWKKP